MAIKKNSWPELNFTDYKDTIFLLHHWIQVAGKVREKLSPWENHSWNVALYVDTQGLTTGPIPYENGVFEIKFDFTLHELKLRTSDGTRDHFPLGSQSVASFYEQLTEKLKYLGINVKINSTPVGMQQALPFEKNTNRIPYLPNETKKLWKAMIQIQNVLNVFRSGFTGKQSPVQLFWTTFDLSHERFSGRPAPEYEGKISHISKKVLREAFSHEFFEFGFSPGNEHNPEPVFYTYSYPNHTKFGKSTIQPSEAIWNENLNRFQLPYHSIQSASNPSESLLHFLQSTYEAAALAGKWDRQGLEPGFSPT